MMNVEHWRAGVRGVVAAALVVSTASVAVAQTPSAPAAAGAPTWVDPFASEISAKLSVLNRPKLEALLGNIGAKPPAGFYDCLCSGRWHASHVGVRFDPSKGECQFSGLGTWHEPLPDSPAAWRACIETKRYPDGRTMGELIAATLRPPMPGPNPDKVSGDTLGLAPPTGYLAASRLREALAGFQRVCLPTPDNAEEVLGETSRVANRAEILERALGLIAQSQGDTCEGAFAAKLYLQSQSGLHAGEIAVGALKEFVGPDEIDVVETGAKGIEMILRRAARASGVIGTIGSLKDAYEVGRLFNEQYQTAKGNSQAKAAFEAFQSSRGWPADRIAAEVSSINAALRAKTRQIEADEVEKVTRIMRLQPTTPRPAIPGAAPADEAKWADFDASSRGVVREFDERKASHLFEMAGLQMTLKAVRDYRGALAAKGCNGLLAELARTCADGKRP